MTGLARDEAGSNSGDGADDTVARSETADERGLVCDAGESGSDAGVVTLMWNASCASLILERCGVSSNGWFTLTDGRNDPVSGVLKNPFVWSAACGVHTGVLCFGFLTRCASLADLRT